MPVVGQIGLVLVGAALFVLAWLVGKTQRGLSIALMIGGVWMLALWAFAGQGSL
jgi:hypothetical protein